MKKIKIKEKIHHKINYGAAFTYKDLKKLDLQDDDIINMGYDEGFYTENNSVEPHFFLDVYRWREETDEEYENRKIENEKLMKKNAKKRLDLYLELKKEFEND